MDIFDKDPLFVDYFAYHYHVLLLPLQNRGS